MNLQRLYSQTRKAIDSYQMIAEGDHVAVGISGGKDSLTLLYALHGLMAFYPKKFKITAITVDPGFDQNFDLVPVKELCAQLDVPYHIIETEISTILFKERKESNPCSMCGKLRKGAFNQKALELGCNKIAYGHHKNDMIETMLMSMLFEGKFYSFPPVTHLDKTGLTLIRPLMLLDESDIIGFKNKYNLPVVPNECPVDGHTKREYAKQLVRQLNTEHPGAKDRMFHSIVNGNIEDWPKL